MDLRAGTVTVTDTGHHKPKNRPSHRPIPVCSEVREALRSAMEKQKVIPTTGEIFLNSRGTRWTPNNLDHCWARKPVEATEKRKAKPGGLLYQAAAALDMPRLSEVEPYRLRSAFITMASRLEVPDRLLKTYSGHSSGDVLGGHYRKITLAELGGVARKIEAWRTLEDTGTLE